MDINTKNYNINNNEHTNSKNDFNPYNNITNNFSQGYETIQYNNQYQIQHPQNQQKESLFDRKLFDKNGLGAQEKTKDTNIKKKIILKNY